MAGEPTSQWQLGAHIHGCDRSGGERAARFLANKAGLGGHPTKAPHAGVLRQAGNRPAERNRQVVHGGTVKDLGSRVPDCGMPGLMNGHWKPSAVSGPQRLRLDARAAPGISATAPACDSSPASSSALTLAQAHASVDLQDRQEPQRDHASHARPGGAGSSVPSASRTRRRTLRRRARVDQSMVHAQVVRSQPCARTDLPGCHPVGSRRLCPAARPRRLAGPADPSR
jgi:hypothetical protein